MAGFDNQLVLLLLLLLPGLFYMYNKILTKKKKAAMQFSNLSYIKSAIGNKKKTRRDSLLFYVSIAVITLMIIGFADPHISLEQTKEGVNVVLVIDVSGSMQAEDYPPNRLESAKNSAEILLNSLQSKDNAGIVIFETGATTAAYLSPYKDRIIEKLRDILPRDGKTAIGDGLSLGIDMAVSVPNKQKVVILLSDGVNNAGVITPVEAIAFAKSNDIQVYTIGLGSENKVILGYDFFGNAVYAELDEATLKAIAENTEGKYFKSIDSQTLESIYRNISQDIKREQEDTSIKDWFFAASLGLFLIQIYMRYGKGRIIQ